MDEIVEGSAIAWAAVAVIGAVAVVAAVAWTVGVRAIRMARRGEESRVGLRVFREARRVIGRLGGDRSAGREGARTTEVDLRPRPQAATADPAPSTDELIRAAAAADPFARADAVGSLRGHAGAEPALLQALRDDYPQVRRAAIGSLVGTGDPIAIRAVIDLVDHDPSAEVRAEALEALSASLGATPHRGEAGGTG